MPRDSMTTRRLLAKIDREMDLYVVADRMRQAIYDESDYVDKLEKRIIILENIERERKKALDDSAVRKIVVGEFTARKAKFGDRLFWMLLAGAGTALLAIVTLVIELWPKK